MKRFELGKVVMTLGISEAVSRSEQFAKEVLFALGRYENCDWSDMEYEHDKEMNNEAIRTGEDRIFATYNTCKGKIYIITEWDRSYTTILFPEEY